MATLEPYRHNCALPNDVTGMICLPPHGVPTFTEGFSDMYSLSAALTSFGAFVVLKSFRAFPDVVCRGNKERGVDSHIPPNTLLWNVHTPRHSHSPGSEHLRLQPYYHGMHISNEGDYE